MASYKNESNLTKAIKLSRLPRESMVNLLLNALTDCNYHSEVKRLAGELNASSDYHLDQKADRMARNLTSKLSWDAEAVSRVIANASKDKEIVNALKKVGLYGGRFASRRKNKGLSVKRVATRHLQAGKGLKSVQAIMPGTSDGQANYFLNALSASILDGRIIKENKKLTKGEVEVEVETTIHPSSPSYPEADTIKGVIGSTNRMKILVSVKDLEITSKMNLDSFFPSEDRFTKILCVAVSKNIESRLLSKMDDEEIDLVFGETQYDIDVNLPNYYEISECEVIEYDYEVKDIYREDDRYLTVIVSTRIEYDPIVKFDQYSFDQDRY